MVNFSCDIFLWLLFAVVDLRIFGFTLTVCLSYLMKVADFFTSGMAPSPTSSEDASVEVVTSTSLSSHPNVKSSKASKAQVSKPKSSATNADAGPAPPPPMITVNIRVEKPDIILVENMEDLDTNAIIFNVCLWI